MILSNIKPIRIWGGLGNQLFQFALAKFLEKNFKYKVYFNINSYNNEPNSRKFLLKDIMYNFDYEVVNFEENYLYKLLNYKTENLYKHLIKNKFSRNPKI